MKNNNYSGVYSIPVTPFNEDLSIDFVSLRKCIEYFIEKKTDGILLPVNVSEDPLLSVVKGTGMVLENLKKYEAVLL